MISARPAARARLNLARGTMFSSIVVGTDGSDTATQAVRQAVDMAESVSATFELVSAYEPVLLQRLQDERRDAPEDVQWAINPMQDVEASLAAAADRSRGGGERQHPRRAREIPPM